MIIHELVTAPPFSAEVMEGLAGSPKSLPCKLFYDAAGSTLFEEITRLPEYYLTRTELELLRQYAGALAEAALGMTIVELGAGSAAKTRTLLQALGQKQLRTNYVPVDISPSALREAREQVSLSCQSVHVHPIEADLGDGFDFLDTIRGPKLVLYLGSSIGNFDLDSSIALLSEIRAKLTARDGLLIATDMAKDTAILGAAYDDAQGVTAEFNKNILHRINRDMAGNFDPASFRHVALWNPEESRMEMHLESTKAQSVRLNLLRLQVEFARGERIHTENSYKYTMPMVQHILGTSGFHVQQTWTDWQQWYALHWAGIKANPISQK